MARLTVSYGMAQISGPIFAAYRVGFGSDFHTALVVGTIVGIFGTLVSA